MTPAGVTVLGLGNVLAGDDGVGIVALEELLDRYRLPAGVACLDGGVLGLQLLGLVEDARRLLVLDAVAGAAAPGTLVRLDGDQVGAAMSGKLSMHQVGFREVLAAAAVRGKALPELVVLGVVPSTTEEGIGLSAPVRAALGLLVEGAAAQLEAWGVEVHERAERAGELAGPWGRMVGTSS